jgi:hypothetical protein
MRFILHILRKDLERHWREIAFFVAICGTWTWESSHPLSWMSVHHSGFIPVLLFGMWIFLTVRVIHGECLLGEREFWRTRPYEWGHLMTAKALFLLICLNGPLLLAQLVLLSVAGIPLSLSLVPGLMFLQIEFVLFVTFPTSVIAAMTETAVQWVLTVAGLFVYGMMLSWFPWDKLPATFVGQENVASILGGAIIVPALGFALVWQYAHRRVWTARMALGIAAFTVPLVILIAPTPLMRAIAYPRSSGDTPMQLSIAPAIEDGKIEYMRTDGLGEETNIEIPIRSVSIDPDAIVDIDGMRILLTGDNGWRWQSDWLNRSLKLSGDWPLGALQFGMPAKIADQLQGVHANASVELAYGVYKLGRAQKVDASAEHFTIPDVAYCKWNGQLPGQFTRGGPSCAAPLRLPGVVVIRVESTGLTCHSEQGEPPIPQGHFASRTNYGNDVFPADFDPDPVHNLDLNFGNWIPPVASVRNPKINRTANPCRGTPLIVRSGNLAGKMRSTFSLGSIGSEKRVEQQESE